jgi:hypothetical protein
MNKLLKKLNQIGELYSYNASHESIWVIHQAFVDGKAELIRVEKDDYSYSSIPLKERLKTNANHMWSTYDGCRSASWKLEAGRIVASVILYNGSLYNGHREDVRLSIEVSLPLDFVKNIEREIESAWVNYMKNLYKEEEERKKSAWIAKKEKELLR